jgi:Histidine kinase-, DNA gyrase B-, and HSP90-like ATPase
MFDPFFTTKGVGEGSGLGLSLVHGIVADMGRAIDVRSTVGQGSAFTIWLPMVGEASAPSGDADAELPRGHGQVVMIVDDEKALVAIAEEMLERARPAGISEVLRKPLQSKDIAECFGRVLRGLDPRAVIES